MEWKIAWKDVIQCVLQQRRMAFTFSDLVVLPILRIQTKYYGLKMEMYFIDKWLTALVLHSTSLAFDLLPGA